MVSQSSWLVHESSVDFLHAAFAVLLGFEPNEAECAASAQSLDAWRKLPEAGQGGDASDTARANLIWVLLNRAFIESLRLPGPPRAEPRPAAGGHSPVNKDTPAP